MTWLKRCVFLICIFALLGTNGQVQDRIEVVYTANDNLVGKNTSSMFDQNIQQGGYSLVAGLKKHVSAARFGATYVAWKVEAYDALGGSAQYKIRVAAGPTDISRANTLVDGGRHGDPALAKHGDRLICVWISQLARKLCLSSTSNGRTWTNPFGVDYPTSGIVLGIDLVDHSGSLYLAGVVRSSGVKKLFAVKLNVHPGGDAFNILNWNEDIVPTANPSDQHRVSIASNGNRLSLVYVQGNSIRITHFKQGSWSSPEIIQEFLSAQAVGGPSIAYCKRYCYICYPNGSILTVRKRHENANNWGPANLRVNDAQVQTSYGADIHKISVITGVSGCGCRNR